MKKTFNLILIVFLVFSMNGCSIPKVTVDISSPIEFYSPVMSSVPGMPINVEVNVISDDTYEISIEMETDHGTILEWGSDMKVNDLGRSVTYHDGTRYWSPFEEAGLADSAEIDVKVTVKGNGFDSVVRTNVKIVKNADGMYIIKND